MSSDNYKTYFHTTPSGSRIFVEECGSGPLMVLMHGLGGTTNAFQPLIRPFASKFTMLRFDFPGSGFSTFATAPSIPSFVADFASIPSALSSVSHIPAVVERMTGIGALARKGIEGIRDSTIANNVAPSSSDLVRMVVRQMVSAQDSEGYAATCEAVCAKSHVNPDYGAIKCPVVLVAGDQDMLSPVERSEGLRGLLGAGEGKVLLEVVRSGHQQVLEDTDGVVRAMNALLSLL